MVSARRRREIIGKYGRGKVQTLRLVVQFKEKRNADDTVTAKMARAAAGDLTSNGKIPCTFPANLAGETWRYMTQLELQLKGARTTHKNLGGGLLPRDAARHRDGERESSPHPPPLAGQGYARSTCFTSTSTSAGSLLSSRSLATFWGCNTPA